MNFKINNLFPTAVIEYDNFLSEQQCKDIVEFCKKQEFHDFPGLIGKALTTYTWDDKILDKIETNVPTASDINSKVKQALSEYSSVTGILNPNKISNSWCSIQDKNSSLIKHAHPRSAISGALFLKVDNDSSRLFFYNPNPYHMFNEVKEYTDYTYLCYSFKPQIGKLILFPSWLLHGSDSDVNMSEERIIISLNSEY